MRKNKLLTIIFSLTLIVSCVFGLSMVGASASTAAPSFELNKGASIRVEAPAGIRFQTKILKTEYASMVEKNAEYGTLIIPELALGDDELTVSVDTEGNLSAGANVLIIKADNINTKVEDDENTTEDESLYIYYNAVVVGEKDGEEFTGLPKEFYGVNLVARSYVVYDGEDGKVVEYAENITTRSISEVAKDIIIENSTDYGATDYEYFHDITDYVASEKALSKVTVDKLAETPTCEVEIAGDEVKAVYVLGTDELVSAENWTYADNKFAFTADYLGTVAFGEHTYKLLNENSVRSLTVNIYGESTDGSVRLAGFDNSDTLSQFSADVEKQWLDEYMGAKGVIKATYTSVWEGIKFDLPYTLEELQEKTWDYLDIRIFTEMSGDVYEGGWPSATQGQWSTIRYSKENLVTQFETLDKFYNALENGSTRVFAFWNAGTIYVDYVDFGSYVSDGNFDMLADGSSGQMIIANLSSVEYLPSFGEVNNVVKGTYTGAYSASIQISGNTTVALMQALDWEVLVVRTWFEETEANVGTTKPDPVSDNWNIDGLGSGARGKWVSLCISKTNLATQFGTIDDFYAKFVSTSGALLTQVYNTANSAVYVDSVMFTNYDRTMDFESEEEISFLRSGTNAEWLESAKCDRGRTEYGVISYYHGTTQYAGVKFQFNNYTGLTLDDWDKIQIRIRIIRGSNSSQPGTDGNFSTFYIGNTSTSIGSIDGWSTLTITKQQIEASDQYTISDFWPAFTGENGTRLFWLYYVHEAADWTIQISSISLLQNS